MTDETKTEAKPADTAERPSTIPPDEMARLTDEIVGALKTVYDPEIPADIYELGLIYKVDISAGTVRRGRSRTSRGDKPPPWPAALL